MSAISTHTAAPIWAETIIPPMRTIMMQGRPRWSGFWIYLMSDCILFLGPVRNYAVLAHQFAGGPTGRELFDLQFVLVETMLPLVSSLTYGLATLSMYQNNRSAFLAGSASPSCLARPSSRWKSMSSII